MKLCRRQHSRDGMALVIVMCAVIMLGFLAASFAAMMKVETRLAINRNNDPRLTWAGESGVQYACYMLAHEPGQSTRLNQMWSTGVPGPDETNTVLMGLTADRGLDPHHVLVEDGFFSVTVRDLDRYANINTADTAELQQALGTEMGVSPDLTSVIADSIQDWIDSDDMPRLAGAESDYYQGMNPPYNAHNGPIDDISELRMIKGIREHPEIFFGGVATNSGPTFQHQLGLTTQSSDGPSPGLTNLFTPFSGGRININTADQNVLMLIPGMNENWASTIIQLRATADPAADPETVKYFKSVNELVTAGVDSAVVANMSRYCSTTSSVFEVTIHAEIGGSTANFYALLYRNGRNVQCVRFYRD